MQKESQLKRELGLLDVFCIASGAMISSGLFVLPGLAHALAGPAVTISYMLASLLAMAGMLSQAELVSAMPRAGGTYFYVTRSMGPALGTINGLLTWLSISLKSSFALVGMAAFTTLVVDWDPRFIALGFCLIFLLINFIGIKEAGRVQISIVAVLLILLVIYIVKGVPAIEKANFRPFAPHGMTAIFSTAGFVFVSYGGLLKIGSIAEEVKNPARTVPLGMIISLVSVSVLYIITVFVTSGVLSNEQLNRSLTPISDGAFVFMGEWGKVALGVAAILAFVSTANAGIMSASRYPLALSRDHLLPEVFGRINPRFKTPGFAILVTGIIMISALFLDLYVLVEVASTVLILTFMFSCLCVIIMRESKVQNYQPKFLSPLYPWAQLVGIFGCWLLVVNMGKEALFIGSLLFACGLTVFWFYGRLRVNRDFALLHLIERITPRELVDVSLERELREIILERDEVVKDRFDRIIEKSDVLDISGSVTMYDFFKLAAEKLSPKIDVPSSHLVELLLERERQSSTVLSPGLAIPHIIIEGAEKFCILVARCREGIIFPGKDRKVHIVFVIAGTKDERNFHLRALSAIAQIVQDPKFEQRWMKARDTEVLRDLILTGKRKRHD
ncbi:MAG: amino acid permease [Candidatus Omnitrophica bacterium]|nr:amino acid permease [Candidatus Omnitrophota bacterium]